LHGAVFLDAGNVWTLKNEPSRPGGQLRAKTFFKDLALGTGVGLRFDISMLVIRGDLGIGIHAPYDTGKRGYYNMESFKKSLAFHLAIGYPF
ncbi:BamA/TamA family outer membrane protein, partial [uncultured Duncaniella sp.]